MLARRRVARRLIAKQHDARIERPCSDEPEVGGVQLISEQVFSAPQDDRYSMYLSSSIRSCFSRRSKRSALPDTRMSPPGLSLSFAIWAGTSPEMSVELFHERSVRVFDATYLGRALIRSPRKTSVANCQNAAQS